ncbi:glycosyltransferase family 2 protein [Polaribacter undariae]|uniref:Glycosyltransferase family 2 protein n=1 Tax=Polaribacter sejongensis TaxID=985043 RepID=A0AAJ1QVB5_9FLAO|nr:glycosyltransferase family 2 protein [Polaribacter undariae]MDN3618938.1 glycosyltransferase family 2 protein [Polaribacter undariae]UWD33027.1 glycosyltransferase [Polaribacter undariae]
MTKNKNPLVSIIIPSYNRVGLFGETLDSIILQSYINWECIVVDDGSTDGTITLLQKYREKDARIKVFKRPNNLLKGANSCRNYGFSKAKGLYINWFDSDDIMYSQFLELKVKCFLKNEDVNCVISKTEFFRNDFTNIIGQENRTFNSSNLLEDFIQLKRSWYVCDPMWKKEYLNDKKLLSIDLLKGQDRDFHIRMLMEKDIALHFLDEYLVGYRQHEITISYDFSKEVALSIHNRLKERFIELKEYRVSNETLMFLNIELYKNYRFLRYKEFDTLGFMLKNRINHRLYFIWLLKFIAASISYRLIGKGYFLLK